MSGEALQIAVKRREVKSKGEKESYTHVNAEFQKIAKCLYGTEKDDSQPTILSNENNPPGIK